MQKLVGHYLAKNLKIDDRGEQKNAWQSRRKVNLYVKLARREQVKINWRKQKHKRNEQNQFLICYGKF